LAVVGRRIVKLVAQALAPNALERLDEPDAADELPYLADGVELIGKYEDSGFRSAPYLVKRGDGQVIQVSELIYLVAAGIDVSGDVDEVADRVSVDYGREVSPDNVRYLIDKKLRPTGLLWSGEATGESAPVARANPLLALRLRLPLVPERVHRAVTTSLKPLFWPPVVLAGVAMLLALDVWLVTHLGTRMIAAAQALIYMPQLLLPITGLTILMGAFHETGHAAAARYGGAKPGAMGAGIYLVWPVFYTDVTDSYRLNRRGRLRTDLGGVYFNALFMVAVGALYIATGNVLFLVFVLLAHVETLRQFLPFIRLDGYYIVADLAGVPNLFSYMAPSLARAARLWRGDHTRRTRPLDALTRRAQIVLVLWACLTGPILAVNIAMLVVFLPKIAGAAWGSAGVQASVLQEAIGHAQLLAAANAALGLFFLVLPAGGMGYIAVRMLRRLPAAVRKSWGRRPAVTGVVTGVLGLAIVLQMGLVWPHTFSEAASEPARARAEAEAAAAQARSRLARGVEAVSDAVARVAPGVSAPHARPARPAPVAPEAPPSTEEWSGDGSSYSGDSSSDDGTGLDAPEPSPAPAAPPAAPARPPGRSTTPTTVGTAGGGSQPGDPSPSGESPGQTTTTQPRLPTVEELLSLLEPKS
jgi:putative peptide zinc metalloprotease protein